MIKVEEIIELITKEIKSFTDIATIGMSGGADSTCVAVLSTLALGKENVYGYGFPYDRNDIRKFNSRSARTAKQLGIKYEQLGIGNAVDVTAKDMDPEGYFGISPLNLGNIKSRMRMIYLYSLNARVAEKTGKRCRVIGTGNLSEDFIGYDTKGGDALADIFPLGELYKSEVYQLLDYFVEKGYIAEDMVDRVPSAGLENGQTDEEDLGFSYDEMEPAVRFCLANYDNMKNVDKTKIIEFVWARHIANKHKHEAPRIISLTKSKLGR